MTTETVKNMTTKERNELKTAIKNAPRKIKVAVPAPGTFCNIPFCFGPAKHFMDERPICNIHNETFKAIDLENAERQ